MKNTAKRNIIALSLIKGVGAAFMKRNLSLLMAYKENIDMLSSIGGKVTLAQLEHNYEAAERIIKDCEDLKIEILTLVDNNYPKGLLEIKDPPPVLYLKGNISLLNFAVGIIGTRKSSPLGNKIAGKVGEYFSKHWAVCNGLVEGIDKHAVLVNNWVLPNVIGVLSGGLNYESTSSKVTQDLARKVLENNGLLVSENDPFKKEDQFSGSKASRIQAGISKALILVQSTLSGGSKYTIKAFSELNRPLGIIEFSKNSEYLNDDIFSANRTILSKQKAALAEICDIKKIEKIKISKIMRIGGNEDYKLLESEIS